MNTVPFDQLGPGQSGRLAYQVLGQDGPIFNPQNIRYLSPDSVEIPATSMDAGASALSVGLAGASLIGSVLNLGISLFNAFQISGLHSRMNRIERKIDYIVSKVDRIDTQVAENNLRHALNHVLQKSVSPDGIDLRVLASLRGDLSKFYDSLPFLMLNFSLQFSSDVRDRLQMIYELAYEIRRLAAQRYNISVDGDPGWVVALDPDYFSLSTGYSLMHHVKGTMTIPKTQSVEMGLLDFDDYLPEHHSRIFEDEETREQGLYDLSYGWLYQTDAGLLWRTWMELDGIADGYENTFWPQLKESEPCGINQIDVACDVPLLENT